MTFSDRLVIWSLLLVEKLPFSVSIVSNIKFPVAAGVLILNWSSHLKPIVYSVMGRRYNYEFMLVSEVSAKVFVILFWSLLHIPTLTIELYLQPCSMGFATGGKTFFLWGGCMMVRILFILGVKLAFSGFWSWISELQMHADDFRNDRHGVVSELRDGGYSDDMTLAAIAGNSLLYWP